MSGRGRRTESVSPRLAACSRPVRAFESFLSMRLQPFGNGPVLEQSNSICAPSPLMTWTERSWSSWRPIPAP